MSTRGLAAAPEAPRLAPAAGGAATRWIANAGYDALFFVGSIGFAICLTALALAAPTLAMPATIVGGVLFANTHNLLTGFFFLDRENLAYYRRYPHYYFTVPVLLLLGSMAIFVILPPLAFTLHFVFTTWHVVRQSVGVQKLYLGRARASDFDRRFDAGLIYTAVVVLHLFAIWKYRPLWATKALAPAAVHSAGTALTAGVLLILAGLLCARVLWLGRRSGQVAWQRLGFGLGSIVMYAPYLAIDNYQVAFMAGILPHYVQYHGYLLARRPEQVCRQSPLRRNGARRARPRSAALGSRRGDPRWGHGVLPGTVLPRRERVGAAAAPPPADLPRTRLLLRTRLDALLPGWAALPVPLPGDTGGDPALSAGSAATVVGERAR